MEEVEAVGNRKAATVVFRLDGPEWEVDGRALFNLNPARTEIFRELARVVRPGGVVYAAELIAQETVTTSGTFTEAEWFA